MIKHMDIERGEELGTLMQSAYHEMNVQTETLHLSRLTVPSKYSFSWHSEKAAPPSDYKALH